MLPGRQQHFNEIFIYDLKLIIDGHIGLAVKVLEGDVEAVAALGGELVKLFETKPQLT